MGKRGKGRLPYRSHWERYLHCHVCSAFPGLPCHDRSGGVACRGRRTMMPDLCDSFPIDSYVKPKVQPDIGLVVAHVRRNRLRIQWRNGHETEVDIVIDDMFKHGVEPAFPDAITRLAFLSGDQPV